ncbi:MAG: hypothetical protein R3C12_16140 [Planctomycetaceae bacterium]
MIKWRALLAPVLEGEQQTNMAYFGDDHHLFTAQLRLLIATVATRCYGVTIY